MKASENTQTTIHILRATLKAEALRIRHLRKAARHHRDTARKLRKEHFIEMNDCGTAMKPNQMADAETRELHDHHFDTFWRTRSAADCPSQRARCANLALGFLRGRHYLDIEERTSTPDWVMRGVIAREIAKKAGATETAITEWLISPARTSKKTQADPVPQAA